MGRRIAREMALQALFQLDWNHAATGEEQEKYENLAMDMVFGEQQGGSAAARAYMEQIVRGTRLYLSAIDEKITGASREWKIHRMASVDRNITRLAIYEMIFSEERIKPSIAINEAVELAKKFGSDDSGRFVNGILGAVAKQISC